MNTTRTWFDFCSGLFLKEKKPTIINKIEGVPLLSSEHSIVFLDTTEEDSRDTRQVLDDIEKIQQVLASEQSTVLGGKLKSTMQSYLDSIVSTRSQRQLIDSFNITSDKVAYDIVEGLKLDQQMDTMNRLLSSVVRTQPSGGEGELPSVPVLPPGAYDSEEGEPEDDEAVEYKPKSECSVKPPIFSPQLV